jgi:hypothetical protein
LLQQPTDSHARSPSVHLNSIEAVPRLAVLLRWSICQEAAGLQRLFSRLKLRLGQAARRHLQHLWRGREFQAGSAAIDGVVCCHVAAAWDRAG